jgi:hypothetical protein
MASAPRAILLLGSALLALFAGGSGFAEPKTEVPYLLDPLSRTIPARGPVQCPKVDLVDHRGDTVRFSPPARVFSGFSERLTRLERVVADVGVEVYGRAPLRIVNLGTFNCRRMTSYPDWVSEHGLGNAIDVAGFDFGPLPKDGKLADGLHKAFKGPFEVRLDKHWNAKIGITAVHARFLKTLARRLIARKDVFRVLLGPGYPGHADHFHFDMAPFRLVEIYDKGELLTAEAEARSP